MEDTQTLDDKTLVAAIARGDRECFGLLYDRHAETMMAVAYRMLQSRRDAEDLLHDVFLEIWRKAHTYDPSRAKVLTWLLIRLRSRALDRMRMRKKRTPVEDQAAVINKPDPKPDPEQRAQHHNIKNALRDLPENQRLVLELGYFRGYSSSEIAKHLNIPLGTVKSRVAAGLNKLRAALVDTG